MTKYTINGLKRGTVIRPVGDKDEWSGFYGRVLKVINLGLVVTVDCGKYCRIQHINEIDADGYKGRYDRRYRNDKEHWLAMPNLRYLKRICQIYNPKLIPYPSGIVIKMLESDPGLLDGVEYQR